MPAHVSQSFRYCPRCGVKTTIVGSRPYACSECGFRFYFSPTAAVGAILSNDQGELLFLIRGRDPGLGKYGLPGGFVDVDETLEAALAREVEEETSFKVTGSEYLCSFPNTYAFGGSTVDVLDSFFVCQVDSIDQPTAQPGEVNGFLVARPNPIVLDNMAFESHRQAIQVLLDRRETGQFGD